MLKIEKLKAGYTKNTMILNDFSLEMNPGERVGIIGKNGCGKSTLVKALMGLTPYTSGKLMWENKIELKTTPVRKRNKLGIAYFMQGGQVFGNLSVKDNLRIAMSNRLFNKFEDELAMLKQYSISLFNNAQRLNLLAENLSGGEKHILSFAMTLLSCPNMKLLIADEPSAGVAQLAQMQLLKFIEDALANNNTALLLIEHNRNFLKNLTSKTIEIKNI